MRPCLSAKRKCRSVRRAKCISRRLGAMLHEAVIVTAISSMIVLLGIRLLHQSMNFGAESRARIAFRQTSERLAIMFRDDVHNASNISFDRDGTFRIQFLDRGSVAYRSIRPEKPHLERTYIDSDGLVMREEFRLLDRSLVSFSQVGTGEAVAFEIMSSIPGEKQLQRHELRTVARAGRTQKICLQTQLGTTTQEEVN